MTKIYHKLRKNPVIGFIFRHSLAVFTGLALLLHLCSLDGGHNWGGDFASYLRQAYCIADGSFEPFLSQNTFTIRESDFQMGPIAYPWGYPLLLTPFAMFGRSSLFLMKIPVVVCFLIFLFAVHGLFRHRLKRIDLLLLLGVFAFSPVLASGSNDINSDTVFLCFAYVSLLLCRKCLEPEEWLKNLLRCFAAGLVCGYAVMIRMNGIVLLPAFILASLVWEYVHDRRFGRALIRCTVLLLGSGLTISLFLAAFPSGEASHVHLLLNSLSLQSLSRHLYFYVFKVWTDWFKADNLLPAAAGSVLLAAAVFALVRGFLVSFRKQMPETVLHGVFVCGTLAVYMVWPAMALRFIYPLLPLLLFWILRGIRSFRIRRVFLPVSFYCRMLILALTAIGLALCCYRAVRLRLMGNPLKCASYTPQSMRLYEYIRKNTPPDAVILFFKPRVMTLQTGRRSLYIFRPEHLEKGDYYCYTDDVQDGSADLLKDRRLKECYRDEQFRFFRIQK